MKGDDNYVVRGMMRWEKKTRKMGKERRREGEAKTLKGGGINGRREVVKKDLKREAGERQWLIMVGKGRKRFHRR